MVVLAIAGGAASYFWVNGGTGAGATSIASPPETTTRAPAAVEG
jgi:hypothetical protein